MPKKISMSNFGNNIKVDKKNEEYYLKIRAYLELHPENADALCKRLEELSQQTYERKDRSGNPMVAKYTVNKIYKILNQEFEIEPAVDDKVETDVDRFKKAIFCTANELSIIKIE